jgi:hypothetical protein
MLLGGMGVAFFQKYKLELIIPNDSKLSANAGDMLHFGEPSRK